jgi:hypothetical protein
MMPSAQPPTHSAVSGVMAAPINSGGSSGCTYSFASSIVMNLPSSDTVSPRHSARITSTHSFRRSLRFGLSIHPCPVMCSFMYWPLPSATQNRPGNICDSVAAACAMMAG